MPRSFIPACSIPGCPNLRSDGSLFCLDHVKESKKKDNNRPNKSQRGYGYQWTKIRKSFLVRHPICFDCTRQATEVHHIQKIKEGGTNAFSNLMPLCKSCHSVRTRRGE